jgi:hypothetical protein
MIWVELALVNQAVLAGVDCFNDCYLMKDSRQDTAETDRYLFLLIVLEDLPFSIVRKDNFKKFTKSLSYKPFSVPFLMKMLHFVESDLEDHICDLLKDQVALGLVADGWTAKILRSTWFGVLVTFINANMEMITLALRLHRVSGRTAHAIMAFANCVVIEHTGQALCDVTQDTMEAFGALDIVRSISTDNASVDALIGLVG